MKHSQVLLTPARHYLIPEEMSCVKSVTTRSGERQRDKRGHVGWVHGGHASACHAWGIPACAPHLPAPHSSCLGPPAHGDRWTHR